MGARSNSAVSRAMAVSTPCDGSTKKARRTGTWLTKRSFRYRTKLAGWLSFRPMYSSRWNMSTFDQSTSSRTSASSVVNWDAPVDSSSRASPRSRIASLR